MKNNSNKINIKDIRSHAREFIKLHRALKSKRKTLDKTLKHKIYRNILKRKQNKINNELKKLELHKLANIDKISERDLVNIKKYNAYPVKTSRQMAKLRNIDSNMSKTNTIYTLIRSKPVINEEKYLSYLNDNSNNDIDNKINEINMHLNKKDYKDIKKDYMLLKN